MFQIVLISVIAYLAACYGYGLFLLVKLYGSRRAAGVHDAAGAGSMAVESPILLPAAGERLERRAA